MQRNTQYLLIGLVAIILLWQGGQVLDSAFLKPMREQQQKLSDLETSIEQKDKEVKLLDRQQKNLNDWKRRSLPPDEPVQNTKLRPDALNAQRLYQDWLGDIAQLSGFEELDVSPDRRAVSRDNVFVSVVVKIKAKARYEQLCRFLDRFYRTDLLHRITSLRVQTNESEGDPFLSIQLEAEGLVLLETATTNRTPQKRRLFERTTLADELTEDATEIKVAAHEGFPKNPGFSIRLRNEFLTVTEMEGAEWKVQRAQDATSATSHPAGTIVELSPLLPNATARTVDEIKQLLDGNIFVKPAPPVQYKPRIAPLGEKSLTRGKPIEFTIVVMGYDLSKGRPAFSLVAPTVAGVKLDKSTGKFSWTPSPDQKSGKYTVKFEVQHPSAPGGQLNESVNILLRDPNTTPKIVAKPAPIVFLGRDWKFQLEATDAESVKDALTWKLGENSPSGLKIDGKSGVLTWKPDDSTEPGETTIQVLVTDNGDPPQSGTYSLLLNVKDDVAGFTYLTTIFAVNEIYLAKLYDRSQDKFTELRVGTNFSVADLRGTVVSIDRKSLVFSSGALSYRLQIGQSLREISPEKTPVVDETPDASQPSNSALRPSRSQPAATPDGDAP